MKKETQLDDVSVDDINNEPSISANSHTVSEQLTIYKRSCENQPSLHLPVF